MSSLLTQPHPGAWTWARDIDEPIDWQGLRALREEVDRELLKQQGGKDREYRVRQLGRRAVAALRDLEDYARGLHPDRDLPARAPDELLATRARDLHERIQGEILNGSSAEWTADEVRRTRLAPPEGYAHFACLECGRVESLPGTSGETPWCFHGGSGMVWHEPHPEIQAGEDPWSRTVRVEVVRR